MSNCGVKSDPLAGLKGLQDFFFLLAGSQDLLHWYSFLELNLLFFYLQIMMFVSNMN